LEEEEEEDDGFVGGTGVQSDKGQSGAESEGVDEEDDDEEVTLLGHRNVWSNPDNYSALRKYSAPLNFATFCHISGFKHRYKTVFFCEVSTTSGTQS
jgi:hypothetical protein